MNSKNRTSRFPAVAVIVIASIALVAFSRQSAKTIEMSKQVISRGFQLRAEACKEIYHEEQARAHIKEALREYWSDEPPNGVRLATFEAVYSKEAATPNPTALIRYYATAIARGSITASLQSLPLQRPTPDWSPRDTPLQKVWRQVDYCHEHTNSREVVDSSIVDLHIDDSTVFMDEATIVTTIEVRWKYHYFNGTDHESVNPEKITFDLRWESGKWKIMNERKRWQF